MADVTALLLLFFGVWEFAPAKVTKGSTAEYEIKVARPPAPPLLGRPRRQTSSHVFAALRSLKTQFYQRLKSVGRGRKKTGAGGARAAASAESMSC